MFKILYLGCLVICTLLSICSCDNYHKKPTKLQAGVLINNDQHVEIVINTNGTVKKQLAAWTVFENKINETGWAFLEVYTSGAFSNEIQAYSAGWVEGYVTKDLIDMAWINNGADFCSTKPISKLCNQLIKYININLKWIQILIDKNPKDPYWEQVKLFYYQVSGLIDGYKNVTNQKPRFDVDLTSLFLFQIMGDLDDLKSAFGEIVDDRLIGNGHCSALVKLLPGYTDLYVAQDTWTEFQQMIRILKKYTFEYYLTSDSKKFIPVQSMTFSSYPGTITSGDDFYVLSNGMVSMETTIGNGNPDLWKYVQPENAILEGIRSMVANRLAMSGKEWTDIFTMYNSGTYNNQWMIVDYNKFTAGKKPDSGVFYVLEQIPDVTELLVNQTYFGSYNTPFFIEIFNASGGPEAVKKYGDWFSYEHTPRANIFRRDHSKVKDTTSMTRLMRYNNFQKDPLSRCKCNPPYSGENGISARSDLNPINGTYAFGALGHRAHGGIDMKLTTNTLRSSLDFIAVSSPTYDDQPAFQWSKSDFNKKLSHVGHPDLWNFKPIQTSFGSEKKKSIF